MSYGIYSQQGPPQMRRSLDDVTPDYAPGDSQGAALSVAVMIVTAAVFLTILKRSGFRAMVAVGRS